MRRALADFVFRHLADVAPGKLVTLNEASGLESVYTRDHASVDQTTSGLENDAGTPRSFVHEPEHQQYLGRMSEDVFGSFDEILVIP